MKSDICIPVLLACAVAASKKVGWYILHASDMNSAVGLCIQLISHSTSFLASAVVFGISAYPAESQAALMPATQMAFLGRIETPAKKADPVPSLEVTDECLYDLQTQDNGCDEPKSGEGKTANGAQELVSQVQAKTQEWGPGKTAAAVVVGGVGLVALAGKIRFQFPKVFLSIIR